jgi:hypothetical protein
MCVAPFIWDSSEDGPIPAGVSYLHGAVPEGSLAFGGWLRVEKPVDGDFDLYFGEQLLKMVTGPLARGWHEFVPLLEDPTKNFPIEDEVSSRLRLVAAEEIPDGQFGVYVFYIKAEMKVVVVGGPVPTPVDELLMDDGTSFVEQDDSTSHILLSTT